MAYILQENRYDTVEANQELAFVNDSRNYSDAIQVLKVLRSKPVTLITSNSKKLAALKESGYNVQNRCGTNSQNTTRNILRQKLIDQGT